MAIDEIEELPGQALPNVETRRVDCRMLEIEHAAFGADLVFGNLFGAFGGRIRCLPLFSMYRTRAKV